MAYHSMQFQNESTATLGDDETFQVLALLCWTHEPLVKFDSIDSNEPSQSTFSPKIRKSSQSRVTVIDT